VRYLYQRGKPRRVMHLCGYDPRSGEPTMQPLCGIDLPLNTSINVPLGRPTCKRCRQAAS
jgi:hypothetical protein